ncbi:gephyrin-like molybdotransferase receptor GlpR [Amycolatopsis sp., V23-08]|uniref:Gephyrin-like molybdotransferase receptor GlpR n=1 Tax=Amycolatopsis heterodermiae TaxID=3110235 RepID=A0ABU5QXV6_9PSEU|nr:gephyrin-like molybdotransferase receptor GlpR [Amycolatopsis sp., V23-08]MEA5358768.1 gephyrin-like molybdotransferase receptor GlpR [Amycolatopsis sp., V23-08]
MPSSVIIVALAAAWLVVLVPMVARRRQQVARTADSALAARVVRSGGGRNEGREEFAMSDNPVKSRPTVEDDLAELEADLELEDDLDDEEEPEPLPQPTRAERRAERARPGYRPGRGGFDPEAAEIAARAKYSFRQRVVVILLVVAVVTAAIAGFLVPLVWWGHGLADVVLVGYLVYLRRQVRIEEEIRQRRLARFNSTRAPRHPSGPAPRPSVEDFEAEEEAEDVDAVEVVEPVRREVVERRPSPTSRIRRSAVVVDLDDEDPAFEELDEPGTGPYRRAVGE